MRAAGRAAAELNGYALEAARAMIDLLKDNETYTKGGADDPSEESFAPWVRGNAADALGSIGGSAAAGSGGA